MVFSYHSSKLCHRVPHRKRYDRLSRWVQFRIATNYPEIHRAVARLAKDHLWHATAYLDGLLPKYRNGDGVIVPLQIEP